ncbi:CBS domain-containing protein [Myroides sp. mNGS23_01]|nr:CBS domain-containing protein [Myroides sp. mNGS23_01]WHT40265.1 CBS domain-containing protein [Myroides sp. mNGS23_01]
MITLESLFIDAPTLTSDMQVSGVITFLDQHEYSHLSLVDSDNKWIGNLATDLLYEVDETEKIGNLQYHAESFFVFASDDLAKIADTFILNTCNLLPVLDEEMHLKGMLPKAALTANLLESTFLTEPEQRSLLKLMLKLIAFLL